MVRASVGYWPYLAKLLYHKNPGVRKRAAKAILQTPRLQATDIHDKSDEELIAFVREWWETDGMKVQWQE